MLTLHVRCYSPSHRHDILCFACFPCSRTSSQLSVVFYCATPLDIEIQLLRPTFPCYFCRNCVFRDVIVFRKLEKPVKKCESDVPNQPKHCCFCRFGMFFVVRGVRETPKMTPSPRSPKIAFLGVLKWRVAHWIPKVFLMELIELFRSHGTINRTLPYNSWKSICFFVFNQHVNIWIISLEMNSENEEKSTSDLQISSSSNTSRPGSPFEMCPRS